jgi:hypothetical protein
MLCSSPAPFAESCSARALAFNADFKDPIDARRADAERLGDCVSTRLGKLASRQAGEAPGPWISRDHLFQFSLRSCCTATVAGLRVTLRSPSGPQQ